MKCESKSAISSRMLVKLLSFVLVLASSLNIPNMNSMVHWNDGEDATKVSFTIKYKTSLGALDLFLFWFRRISCSGILIGVHQFSENSSSICACLHFNMVTRLRGTYFELELSSGRRTGVKQETLSRFGWAKSKMELIDHYHSVFASLTL